MTGLTPTTLETSDTKRSLGYRLGAALWSIHEEAGPDGFNLFALSLGLSARTPKDFTAIFLAEGQALRRRVLVRLLFSLVAFGVFVFAHPIAAGVGSLGLLGALALSIRDFHRQEELWEERTLSAERFLLATRILTCLLKLGYSQKFGEA